LKTYSKRMMWNPAQEKLVDQVAKLNDKRFQAMIKLKDLLTETVALKWSHTEKHMASIELDAKVCPQLHLQK